MVGVWPGTSNASEIVVLCAHIDDMPSGSDAPGADDNASGSVAVMAAAEILKGNQDAFVENIFVMQQVVTQAIAADLQAPQESTARPRQHTPAGATPTRSMSIRQGNRPARATGLSMATAKPA